MKNLLYPGIGILFLLNSGCIGFFEEAKTLPQDKLLVTFTGAKTFIWKAYYKNVSYVEDYDSSYVTSSVKFRYGLWKHTEINIETTFLSFLIGFKSEIFNKGNFYTSIKPSGGFFFTNEMPFLTKLALLQGFSLPKNDIYWGLGSISSGTNYLIVSAFIGYTQHPGKKNLSGIRVEGGYLYNYERYENEIRDASSIYIGAGLTFDIGGEK